MLPLVNYMAFNVLFWQISENVLLFIACNIVCRSEFPFFILVLKRYRLILPFYTCILCFPLLCALVQKLKSYFLEIKHIVLNYSNFFLYILCSVYQSKYLKLLRFFFFQLEHLVLNYNDAFTQVKLWYNMKEQELIVTLISATNLPPTTKGQFRHPYCKVYLLPDRRSVLPH